MPVALTLVIETSTPQASIALAGPAGIIRQHEFSSDRNHNAMLFAPLAELLDDGMRSRIGRVIVGSGPGSYSGTRVGIAAAQGVAIALGCPAIALPSILAVPSAESGAACLAIGDARRGSYWTARMENHRLDAEPALCDAAELEDIISNAATAGIPVVSFEDPGRFPVQDKIQLEFPDATRLWQTWFGTDEATRQGWSSLIPQPLYLKPPHITPAKRPWLVNPL